MELSNEQPAWVFLLADQPGREDQHVWLKLPLQSGQKQRPLLSLCLSCPI